jgi:hypothetical protein
MARLTDLPVAQATRYAELECPDFATTPWVAGPPLARGLFLVPGLRVPPTG